MDAPQPDGGQLQFFAAGPRTSEASPMRTRHGPEPRRLQRQAPGFRRRPPRGRCGRNSRGPPGRIRAFAAPSRNTGPQAHRAVRRASFRRGEIGQRQGNGEFRAQAKFARPVGGEHQPSPHVLARQVEKDGGRLQDSGIAGAIARAFEFPQQNVLVPTGAHSLLRNLAPLRKYWPALARLRAESTFFCRAG